MTVTAAAIVVGLAWVAKGALAVAIRQQADVEMERIKAGLQRDIEAYRAQLTSDVEIRRLVAERQVVAVVELCRLSDSFGQTVLNHNPTTPEGRERVWTALTDFIAKINESAIILPDETESMLRVHARNITKLGRQWHTSGDGIEEVINQCTVVKNTLRRSLHVEKPLAT